jgi:hypothetical protein
MSYSLASARIVLDASGVHTATGLVSGQVVVNVTNGEVRSVGVYNRSTRKVVTRLKATEVKGDALSFPSRKDRAILDAFVR